MTAGRKTALIDVIADHWLTPSGLAVTAGDRLIVSASGTWKDWGRTADANGYEPPHLRAFALLKRVRAAPWFSLCGAIGARGEVRFHLGTSADIKVTATGPLYLFANDAWLMYWNNEGSISAMVTIESASL